jgi:hypothetical protein
MATVPAVMITGSAAVVVAAAGAGVVEAGAAAGLLPCANATPTNASAAALKVMIAFLTNSP